MSKETGSNSSAFFGQGVRLAMVVVAIGVLALVMIRLTRATPVEQVQSQPLQQISDTLEPETIEPDPVVTVQGRYLFSGTIVLARAVERYAITDGQRDYAQPFSQLDTLGHADYDAWIADLECPVTGNVVSYQQQINNLVFNCPAEFLPELAQYFDIINLANNHTSDMGADGFIQTQANLTQAGLQHVGSYDPASTQDTCEVVGLPITVTTDDVKTQEHMPVALCAWHYFFRDPLPGELEVMEQYAKIMPVFAMQHVGAEYYATASAAQPVIAHKLIDLGAEFVIGNSPHWVQNTEVYKGKLIAYSTGNFIFDQLDSETNRGASFDLSVTIEHSDTVDRWLTLGESCLADNDTCLARAVEQGLSKPELELSWDVVASVGGVREVTRLAPADVQSSVLQRTNWAQTLEQLVRE